MKSGLADVGRLWRGSCRAMLFLAGAAALAGAVLSGWAWAASFLLGVCAGYLNFSWLHQMVEAVGPQPRRMRARLFVFLGLRYLLLGAGGYVIVKVFGMNAIAALLGLFVPIGAIFFETLYELIHGT